MKETSFYENLSFDENKISPTVILETSFTKEIRVLLKEGQLMKDHKTPFPIIVHLLDGEIDFGVNGKTYSLEKGNILTLEGGVMHNLKAKKDSIIRLTLSKFDDLKRVEKEIKNH